MPSNHRTQPLAHFLNRVMQAALKFGFHLSQLGLQALAYRLPDYREAPASGLRANMREAQKVKRLGLSLTAPLPVVGRIPAELHKPRLVGMQLQPELAQSLRQFLPALPGIRLVLKSQHDVVGEPDHDYLAPRSLLTPRPDPQVERVVQID